MTERNCGRSGYRLLRFRRFRRRRSRHSELSSSAQPVKVSQSLPHEHGAPPRMFIAPGRAVRSSAAPRQRSFAQRLVSSSCAARPDSQLNLTQHSARSSRAVRPRSSTRSEHVADRGASGCWWAAKWCTSKPSRDANQHWRQDGLHRTQHACRISGIILVTAGCSNSVPHSAG